MPDFAPRHSMLDRAIPRGRVVFVDDLFRTPTNGLKNPPYNSRWLDQLIGTALRRVGCKTKCLSSSDYGGEIDTRRLMSALDAEPGIDGWASVTTAAHAETIVALARPLFSVDLVVGFGLPPSMAMALTAASVPFLDIEIDPVRFGPGIYLRARSNHKAITDVLNEIRIDEERFWQHATEIRSYYARLPVPRSVEQGISFGLFVGQTEVDLALVKDGKLKKPNDFIGQVATLRAEVDILLVKKHPFAVDARPLQPLIELGNVMLADDNVYGLMSLSNVNFVCGLSSSVLVEARYFEQTVIQLMQADRDVIPRLAAGCSDWITVGSQLGHVATWEAIFGDRAIDDLSRLDSRTDAHIANTIGTRWGADKLMRPGVLHAADVELATPGEHQFSRGSHACTWLNGGWWEPEEWGVWSQPLAGALIPMMEPPAEGWTITLVYTIFQGLEEHQNDLAIIIGARRPRRWSLREGSLRPDGMRELALDVTPDDMGAGGYLLMNFRAFEASSSKAPPDGPDPRDLALGLVSLNVRARH